MRWTQLNSTFLRPLVLIRKMLASVHWSAHSCCSQVPHLLHELKVGSVGGVKGPVRVRLVRFGRKKLPFYRIFVAHSRARGNGWHIELLGFYNPIASKDGNKEISIKSDRVKHWLSLGAQPTDTVRGLYRAGLMKPHTQP